MKRWISILFAVLLVFSLTACRTSGEVIQTNSPGSNGASKPTCKEPPELKIIDSACQEIVAGLGTYEWNWDKGDGTWTGVCADSTHPLEWKEFLAPLITSDDTVELNFTVPPQSISIKCWSDAYWGDTNAKAESANLTGNTLELKDGGYIYLVVATWTGENVCAYGTASYGFYVTKDNHSHTPAEQPQTVDDPVTGYCGNTMTTIVLNGKEYTFMGSDSVNLTDILINLEYDPMMLCDCVSEFRVTTEFGGPYGVNLSEGYARCEEGQADLTPDQVALIQQILDNQT